MIPDMNRIFITALVALFPLCGATAGDDSQKELKRLEGTWEAVAEVVDGTEQVVRKGKGHRLIFQGDVYTLQAGGKALGKGNVKVDPSKKPHTLDLIPSDGNSPGKVIPCLYEWKGDELRVCMGRIGQPRPTGMESKEGSKHILNTYRRVKPKE
jgi:uncharacterized protein (TIGR03067 family)